MNKNINTSNIKIFYISKDSFIIYYKLKDEFRVEKGIVLINETSKYPGIYFKMFKLASIQYFNRHDVITLL